ncbi:MAG: dUTP diphosphatase [Bdellovibrionales bacterium]|jgi:dUTP pyrophosphatase|nr:dUTP diphosphatase [Bdellovibrionales bacterium]MBT3526225.1 dUTP diphosphatase [Bdellovibrionales bacterium]MBT7668147.1 dUTP diphosphatase [Bdellovibrionales bacterium]MBT7768299.1 dUTP diphosphatase [Bdellovibrionales bacterium]
MSTVVVKVFPLPHYDPRVPLPSYQTLGSAGADIAACLPDQGSITVAPGERVAVPTGLSVEIPVGFELQVRPRSGLSLNSNLLIVNAPGTVDSDYRGEIKILLGNFGRTEHTINHGDRIAQLVIAPTIQAEFKITEAKLAPSKRGSSGFGSTGI